MPETEPIRTGPSRLQPTTPRTSRGAESRPPSLHRILSSQHLDDQSVYHNAELEESTEYDTDEEEEVQEEDDERAREGGLEETEEVIEGLPAERDLEKGPSRNLEKKKSNRSIKDPNLVTWDGPDDPANPKNWPTKQKWLATFVVSSFTFISPVSSSMVAPALGAIASEFGITNEVEEAMVLSVFVLAYAIGPLFLGPLSEIYGRVKVLQIANLVYLVFNSACGGARNKGEMIAFRFLSGLGGSAPLAIGGGVLSDAWKAEERGAAISVYSLMPLLGPAIGPIAGGFITERTTWRWAFYATSIADALIQISGLFFLQETYPPQILKKKAQKLRKETGNTALHTEWENPDRHFSKVIRTAIIRPFRLLATQNIVQFLALYMAYLYGLMYLVLSTFPTLWTGEYGENLGISGLNYISLGLGFFLGAQTTARVNDRIYRQLKKKNNNTGEPEFRVPLMFPGSLLVPIGLFIYGWSAQYHTHWIVPNIGACIFAAGVIMGFQCIQTYLVDSYTRYAASAVSAATVLRSLAGFGFPLFAPYMYAALGQGWGNSVLGFIALAIGIPAPVMLWFYGKKLRERSPFAAGE